MTCGDYDRRVLLQNHPGDRAFPVGVHPGSGRRVREARRGTPADRARTLGAVVVAVLLVLAVLVAEPWVLPLVAPDGLADPGFLLAALVLVALLAAAVRTVVGVADWALPRREQQHYLRAGRVPPLTLRQQQLLALDALADYQIGAWNHSLEHWPCEVRLAGRVPVPPRGRGPYLTLPLHRTAALRGAMDRDHKVAGTDAALDALGRAFLDRSVSLPFVDALGGPSRDEVLTRVSALTGLTRDEVAARGVPADPDAPARLLWAKDVMLTVAFARLAWMAGYLTEDQAWSHVERAGDVAFTLFSSWQEYWDEVRLGHAFTEDSLGAVQAFDAVLADYRSSRWPSKALPWPAPGDVDALPDSVRLMRVTAPGERTP
ncbi:uncharacterized protein DUF1266 [Cellulomonas sp. SLBN-39]|nr:uncharacterized protein DUF1266 [Cellulomonas sp. SLBN-39]